MKVNTESVDRVAEDPFHRLRFCMAIVVRITKLCRLAAHLLAHLFERVASMKELLAQESFLAAAVSQVNLSNPNHN